MLCQSVCYVMLMSVKCNVNGCVMLCRWVFFVMSVGVPLLSSVIASYAARKLPLF